MVTRWTVAWRPGFLERWLEGRQTCCQGARRAVLLGLSETRDGAPAGRVACFLTNLSCTIYMTLEFNRTQTKLLINIC